VRNRVRPGPGSPFGVPGNPRGPGRSSCPRGSRRGWSTPLHVPSFWPPWALGPGIHSLQVAKPRSDHMSDSGPRNEEASTEPLLRQLRGRFVSSSGPARRNSASSGSLEARRTQRVGAPIDRCRRRCRAGTPVRWFGARKVDRSGSTARLGPRRPYGSAGSSRRRNALCGSDAFRYKRQGRSGGCRCGGRRRPFVDRSRRFRNTIGEALGASAGGLVRRVGLPTTKHAVRHSRFWPLGNGRTWKSPRRKSLRLSFTASAGREPWRLAHDKRAVLGRDPAVARGGSGSADVVRGRSRPPRTV